MDFFQGQRHKRPWKKFKKKSCLIKWPIVFFWEANSSLKSASFCDQHKCWLCPLEAADCPWTHRPLFRLLTHTHSSKTRRASSSHLILSMRCTALHFTCPVCPHAHNTCTLTAFIYHLRRPGEGMPPMWHMPTAQRLEGCLNSLYEPTPVQICCQRLQIQIREWVSEWLRRTGGTERASKEKDCSRSSATTPKFTPVGNFVEVIWEAWVWMSMFLSV